MSERQRPPRGCGNAVGRLVLTGVAHSELSRTRLLAAGIPVVETWDLADPPLGLVDTAVAQKARAIGRAVYRKITD